MPQVLLEILGLERGELVQCLRGTSADDLQMQVLPFQKVRAEIGGARCKVGRRWQGKSGGGGYLRRGLSAHVGKPAWCARVCMNSIKPRTPVLACTDMQKH